VVSRPGWEQVLSIKDMARTGFGRFGLHRECPRSRGLSPWRAYDMRTPSSHETMQRW
jgi:hypothetical protein